MTDNNEPELKYEVASGRILAEKYGLTAENRPTIKLDPLNVPEFLRLVIPYAEIWGISDDLIREDVIDKASSEDLLKLLNFWNSLDYDPVEEWLAGPLASGPNYSDEYIAISCLLMAASAARIQLIKRGVLSNNA